jgi:hypothetical protein
MEPKFQSSFIPKGPVAAAGPVSDTYGRPHASFFGIVATFLFSISLILALGVFGYERYLLAHIGTLGSDLTKARATMQPDTIRELVRSNQRLISTGDLLKKHTALSPFFDYLEEATLKNVRFTSFEYLTTDKGLVLTMHGQARSYGDVAEQSDTFNKSKMFTDPVFSDLDLDTKGNVIFAFKAGLDPAAVSYQKRLQAIIQSQVQTQALLPVASSTQSVASTTTKTAVKTTASTTQKTATTTR